MQKYAKAILLIVIIAAVVAGVSFSLISTIKKSYVKIQEDTLVAKLDAVLTSVDMWHKQSQQEFNLWLNSPVIQSYAENLEGNIDPWLTGVVDYLSAAEVVLTTLDGTVLSSSNGITGQPFNAQVMANNQMVKDGIIQTSYIHNKQLNYIVFSIPLYDFEDRFVLIAHFLLDQDNGMIDILRSFNFTDKTRVQALVTEAIGVDSEQSIDSELKRTVFKTGTAKTIQYVDEQIFVALPPDSHGIKYFVYADKSELFRTFYIIENLIAFFSLIVVAVIGSIIIQSTAAKLRIERSNLKYRTSFTDSPDPKVIFNEFGQVLELNKSAVSIFGSNPKSIHEFNHPEFSSTWKKWQKSERYQSFSFEIGTTHFNCSLKTMKNEHDFFVLLVCIDTSVIVNISKNIEEKEERLRTTLEATNQGFFDLNFETNKEHYDPSLMTMLGYKTKKIIDRSTIDQLVHPDDYEQLIQMNSELFTTNDDKLRSYEMRMKAKSGKWRYIQVLAKPVKSDPLKTPTRIVGVHTDITKRKVSELMLLKEKKYAEKLNLQLQKAAKVKDEFIATMSHELRTPLNAVISLSDLMKENMEGNLNETQIQYLTSIEDSGRHLLTIINDILDISKIAAGKMEIHKDYCSIEDVIDESIDIVKSLASDKQIEIEKEIELDTRYIGLDRKRIKQVIINLFSNAIKFTEEGRKVGISCSEVGDYIKFIVWDQGIGIQESDMEKLFTEFSQIDSKLARQQEGTGLGLTLVKKFIELHEGSIKVESVFGEGSKFIFTLPIVTAEPVSVFS